jgi:hypothetical protein
MILYFKDPKNSTEKFLGPSTATERWQDIKSTYKNHEKKCSPSLAIKEMQTKTTLRFHLTPVRIAIIKNTTNNRCW